VKYGININQIRNYRVSNIDKHCPIKMYFKQLMITSGGNTLSTSSSWPWRLCFLNRNELWASVWNFLASERSEQVTSFIFSRYFSVSIIFTFWWHVYQPYIKHSNGYLVHSFNRFQYLHFRTHSIRPNTLMKMSGAFKCSLF
jgi:hypothetical protein